MMFFLYTKSRVINMSKKDAINGLKEKDMLIRKALKPIHTQIPKPDKTMHGQIKAGKPRHAGRCL
jgi:hypothetical protein